MPCTAEPGNPTPRGARGKEIARQALGLFPGGNGNPADHAADALQDVSTPAPTQAERSPAHGHEAPVEAIPRKGHPPKNHQRGDGSGAPSEGTGAGHHQRRRERGTIRGDRSRAPSHRRRSRPVARNRHPRYGRSATTPDDGNPSLTLTVADTGPHAALLLTKFAPALARLLDTHALLQADLTGRNFPGPPL
jgi:hypothetical protein